MRATIAAVSILSAIVMGCSGAQKAVRTQDDPKCKTVIEGYLHSKPMFNGKVPALVLHWPGQTTKILTGEILSMNDSGIVFDPEREGPLFDPEAKLYPYASIQCAIDNNGNVAYGDLPEKFSNIWDMEIELTPEGRPSDKPTLVVLSPNERFSYCVPPGVYSVTAIEFSSNKHYVDRSISMPSMEITAKEGATNYIGDLFLDFGAKVDTDVYLIEAKAKYRPGDGVMTFTFGLMGAGIEALVRPGVQGHTLKVRIDNTSGQESLLPRIVSPLRFGGVPGKGPGK